MDSSHCAPLLPLLGMRLYFVFSWDFVKGTSPRVPSTWLKLGFPPLLWGWQNPRLWIFSPILYMALEPLILSPLLSMEFPLTATFTSQSKRVNKVFASWQIWILPQPGPWGWSRVSSRVGLLLSALLKPWQREETEGRTQCRFTKPVLWVWVENNWQNRGWLASGMCYQKEEFLV